LHPRQRIAAEKQGVEFIEYGIDGDETARSQMQRRANGRRSVPQIFINDQHIGGCDDLYDWTHRVSSDQLPNLLADRTGISGQRSC